MPTKFFLDTHVDRNEEVAIRVAVSTKKTPTANSVRIMGPTGEKINPRYWDKTKQRAKAGATNCVDAINSRLDAISSAFNEYLSKKKVLREDVSREGLRAFYDSYFGRNKVSIATPKVVTIFDYFDKFLEVEGALKSWSLGTYRKFETLRNHLKNFHSDLTFEYFNEDGLMAFLRYLRERELSNVSILKMMRFLRRFLKWSAKKGYNKELAFATFDFNLKISQKKVIYLDWDELMCVFNYDIPVDGTEVALTDNEGKGYTKIVHDAAVMETARNIFAFCAFTSLRFSDAINLKRSDINGSVMGITTIKTADLVNIELNKYARAILDKYTDTNVDGFVFPKIQNGRMNDCLKNLCELCEINEPITITSYRGAERVDEVFPKYELITSHAGRRTFVVNALSIGIPPQTIMKWTGHGSYTSMKPYIDVADEKKRESMAKFDEL